MVNELGVHWLQVSRNAGQDRAVTMCRRNDLRRVIAPSSRCNEPRDSVIVWLKRGPRPSLIASKIRPVVIHVDRSTVVRHAVECSAAAKEVTPLEFYRSIVRTWVRCCHVIPICRCYAARLPEKVSGHRGYLRSLPPASRIRTVTFGHFDSRAATTRPAVPPLTTTKS